MELRLGTGFGASAPGSYEEILRDQLASLHATLLAQHDAKLLGSHHMTTFFRLRGLGSLFRFFFFIIGLNWGLGSFLRGLIRV